MTRAVSCGTEARGNEHDEMRQENFADNNERDEKQTHRGDDDGENVPAFFFVVLREIFREDGNEGDAERAGGNEIIQEYREW